MEQNDKTSEKFDKIDAQHINSIQNVHGKIEQQKEIYLNILDEFEEKLNSISAIYAKKILIAQAVSFICLLAMILLKFL